ncbi:MAG TPA: tetratricopeptide repeat protein, partial [Vicinamibacterales bacterium]|nr:tetratricopeptide repeat protein [Vicinamibacterales bacterium]
MWRSVVLVGAAMLVYANALRGPFIYDDSASIVGNEHIRTLRLPDALFSERENPTAGRPLVNLSFAINYGVGGLDPIGYRAVNILLHAGCGLLIFALASRTLASSSLGFAVALLWIVHPLNSEVIDYVTERSESLMALFFLLTLYAGVRALDRPPERSRSRRERERSSSGDRRWTIAAVAACAAGMACKETMVVAPLVVVLYDRAFVFDSWASAWRTRRLLYVGLGATWTLLAWLLRFGPRTHSAGFASGASPWTYLLNQAVMIVRYLRLSVWPTNLVVNYGWPRPLTLTEAAPYAAVVLALIVATVTVARRSPQMAFAGAWLFVILAPTSSIVPIATEVGAERRMYLPLVAIIALVTVAAVRVASRLRAPALATAGLLCVASTALGAGTMLRNREYESTARLSATVDERWPTPVSDALVGYELGQQGRRSEALVRLRRSAEGGYPTAWYNLGGMLLTGGQLDEGISALQRFLQEAPLDRAAVQTHLLLGRAFLTRGDVSQAIAHLQQARAMDPSNAEVLGGLSDALLAARQSDRAADGYRAYLALRPDDAAATLNLGIALAESGRVREAATAFERARDLNPGDARASKNLASLALNAND